jgi:hypothetical protein
MPALWERWPRCSILVFGKIRDAWFNPDESSHQRMTKARAKRTADALGLPRDRVAHGTWIPVCLEEQGFMTVPESAFRDYEGPRFQAPLRVLKGRGGTALGRNRELTVKPVPEEKAKKKAKKAVANG